MNRRWPAAIVAVAVVGLLGLTGCRRDSTPVETGSPGPPPSSSTTPPAVPTVPAGRSVTLGQAFPLDVGESVAVAGEGLRVTYVRLVADSRCPLDVECIWAGNATIAVSIAHEGGPEATLSLETMEGAISATWSNYTVALVELDRGPSPTAVLRVTSG